MSQKKRGSFHMHQTGEQYYFTLTSGNGQVLVTSEMYETEQGCIKGMAAVERAFMSNGWTLDKVRNLGIGRIVHY